MARLHICIYVTTLMIVSIIFPYLFVPFERVRMIIGPTVRVIHQKQGWSA